MRNDYFKRMESESVNTVELMLNSELLKEVVNNNQLSIERVI